MLHEFLKSHREELIERCRSKVALRTAPRPSALEVEHGIPIFLDQLIDNLRLDVAANDAVVGGDSAVSLPRDQSEIRDAASLHGDELQAKGFTVDQVVHDYGDLCQAVTELAIEKKEFVSNDEFHTLNRCLDNAIAEAVTAFGRRRDQGITDLGNQAMGERLGYFAHEMRNILNTAILSFAAIKMGAAGMQGATSAVLDRSLLGLRDLIDRSLVEVRLTVGLTAKPERLSVQHFIEDVQAAATLEAKARGCELTVFPVDPQLAVEIDRQMLSSAVGNLLQNAFKFTRSHSHVSLKAYAVAGRVLIEVEDQCGGLPPGKTEKLFQPFEQRGKDRSGLGLGLSISQRAVEASGGKLGVRDIPGIGCVFTVDLPQSKAT